MQPLTCVVTVSSVDVVCPADLTAEDVSSLQEMALRAFAAVVPMTIAVWAAAEQVALVSILAHFFFTRFRTPSHYRLVATLLVSLYTLDLRRRKLLL